ncbi:MAG: heavy metal translocating P-type ATPase [Patulibacter minatonensis]
MISLPVVQGASADSTGASALPAGDALELAVEGMTCAACAARVERSLGRLDGVHARVNLATERAVVHVTDDSPADAQALIDAVRWAGYDAALLGARDEDAAERAAYREGRRLRQRAIVSAALSLPVLVLAMIPSLQFDGWQWVALVLTTPVVAWAGLPFHRATLRGLRHGTTTMDTLISLGTVAAFAWSVVALLFGPAGDLGMRMTATIVPDRAGGLDHLYFEVVGAVTTFLLAGRYFEARAKTKAGSALSALMRAGASEATLVAPDGTTQRVPIAQVRVRDRLFVRPGEIVPTDGVVEHGHSAVDESLLTGEAGPIDKAPDDLVTGGTVNLGAALTIRANRVGSDTALAQIAALVREAQQGRAPVQRLADRISAVFVPAVAAIAALTLIGYLVAGQPASFAFTCTVAVLIIACPCALGLATPTALLVGTGRGAQLGLLIRGPQVLESTRRVDAVVLDKTGTLTTGRMEVVALHTAVGMSESQALRLVGSAEAGSTHPIAEAIVRHAEEKVGALPPPSDFVAHGGLGAIATVADRQVVVGRAAFLEQQGLRVPADFAAHLADAEQAGRTAIAAGWYGEVQAVVVLADPPKPGARRAVDRLRALGLRPLLVTGDNRHAATAVGEAVGIDPEDVIAEVLPQGKCDVVHRLQAEGHVVAVVGDGINDAPALATADLGIAIGTGTDVAIQASDLTIVAGDPAGAADAIELSRRTLHTIKQNLFWAFAYNVVLIPAAVAGYLNPVLAGLAMAASSLLVVGNALRLRRFRPQTL